MEVESESPERWEYLIKRVCLACRFMTENCPFCSGKGYFQYWVTYDELKAQGLTELTIVAQRPVLTITEPPDRLQKPKL